MRVAGGVAAGRASGCHYIGKTQVIAEPLATIGGKIQVTAGPPAISTGKMRVMAEPLAILTKTMWLEIETPSANTEKRNDGKLMQNQQKKHMT